MGSGDAVTELGSLRPHINTTISAITPVTTPVTTMGDLDPWRWWVELSFGRGESRGVGESSSIVGSRTGGRSTERLTAPVEGMHDAIADRWFGLAGPRAVPLRKAYRAVTSPIYRSVRLTGSALGTAVGLGAIAGASRKELRPLWHSPRGSGIQAVVNAVWGDELESRASSMSIDMGLRDVAGVVIGLDPASLALAFPERSSRLVIFGSRPGGDRALLAGTNCRRRIGNRLGRHARLRFLQPSARALQHRSACV